MFYRALLLASAMAVFAAPASAGNIAACEIVLLESVEEDGVKTGAKMASFRPAAEFISSVYDEDKGHIKDVDGYKIRGVMCERRDVMPTLRDFPILATGIPFSISEDFDTPGSNLITLYYKDGQFHHKYKGVDLTQARRDKLVDMMDVYNLQPHSLEKPAEVKLVSDAKAKVSK